MKKTVLLVAGFISIMAFAGCSKNESQKTDSKIELTLNYYKQENLDGLKSIISEFEKENPNISIKLCHNEGDEQNMALADEGLLYDILQMQSYARVFEYASRGLLMDLTNRPFMNKVLPSSLSAVHWNGKNYGIPMDYAGIGIIYNKDIFAKYGITPPSTYAELQAVCSQLKARGVVPFSPLLGENWSMGHIITMIHTALLKEKGISSDDFILRMNAGKGSYGQVNTAKLFGILDFYGRNISPNPEKINGAEQQKIFANGKAAMMIQGLWAYMDCLKINPNLNAGFIPFPVYNDSKLNTFYSDVDSVFCVSSQSSKAKQEACVKFFEWLLTEKGQRLWMSQYKLIPPVKGVDVTSFGGPYVDLMKSVEEKGSMPWAFSQYPSAVFDGPCKDSSWNYMMKNVTASEVIRAIDKKWSEEVTN